MNAKLNILTLWVLSSLTAVWRHGDGSQSIHGRNGHEVSPRDKIVLRSSLYLYHPIRILDGDFSEGQLYHAAQDPHEWTNLINELSAAPDLTRMKTLLHQQLDQVQK